MDDDEICYECSGYGDDYFINDDGELECYCPYCSIYRHRMDALLDEDGGRTMKPKAIYQSFNSHDCETYYRCPVCKKVFGDWLIFLQEPNENGTKDYCPHCETELEVSRR